MSERELVLVANARMPSQRAQSLQLAQMAAAFERQGARTTLLYARRVPTPPLPAGQDLFDYYGAAPGPRPRVEAVACADWIDRVARPLQFVPARVQELSFARNAARRVRDAFPRACVYSREVETARLLAGQGREALYLEVHRVPGGRLRRRWLAQTAPACRGIVAISGGVRADLEELGVAPEKIRVEHDAVEAGRFEAAPSREEARATLGVPADAPVVVYAGGLLAWKGVDLLIGAARHLPAVTFLVVGGMDADVERLRGLAAGLANVRVEGFRPPADVPTYLAAGDVGVVPNRSQPAISARYTSPLKVFESQAAGLPLVASDLPSLREILAPETEAVFVPPDDEEELAAGIARLLADDELRAAIAGRGRERAAEHTWDARARRLIEWMDSLAA
ncbi:MAG: glycosyltransferase family 4 protein [Planctomycetota bacterium]|nr:glycosyltransferase family 4 protein [Planctomycetota bacterium]